MLRELGLDRHPELRDAYFGHYTRVLWLAQHPTPATRAAAERAAAHLGLPLEVREVGEEALERQLADLLGYDRATFSLTSSASAPVTSIRSCCRGSAPPSTTTSSSPSTTVALIWSPVTPLPSLTLRSNGP